MRAVLTSSILVAVLALTAPAQAQLRSASTNGSSPVQLYDSGASGFLMNTLFNPQHFKMGHSFEMSMGSGGGHTSSLAMYTNSLMWRFGDKFAARADIAMAYSPYSSGFNGSGSFSNSPKVFLRNAQIDYQPLKNMTIHLQIQQSPYGHYAAPYGYYGSSYGFFPRYRYR